MPGVVIETPRLVLREMTMADVDRLAEVLCDRENMIHYPNRFERPEVEAWIARRMQQYSTWGHSLWALDLKAEDRMIGDCGLTIQSVDGNGELEVGYHLARAYQGRGYATEAARACIDYAFTKLGAARVISLIRAENMPSRRVAERNGLSIEKVADHAGSPHIVYGVSRAEWLAGGSNHGE